MTDKERTLTFSEQKAYDTVLRLRELNMVPSSCWQAIDLESVRDAGYDESFGGTWKIKKREVVFEWSWKKPTNKIVLELSLRGEIPLNTGDEEMQGDAQKRWFVVGINIYLVEKVGSGGIVERHYPKFKLEGEEIVDFLLNGLKSFHFNEN